MEARREGAAAQAQAFKRAQGANHLMSPVAARKLRAELAKVHLLHPADTLLQKQLLLFCS